MAWKYKALVVALGFLCLTLDHNKPDRKIGSFVDFAFDSDGKRVVALYNQGEERSLRLPAGKNRVGGFCYDADGVENAELYVNGDLVSRESNPRDASLLHPFSPYRKGLFLLMTEHNLRPGGNLVKIVVHDSNGERCESSLNVEVAPSD